VASSRQPPNKKHQFEISIPHNYVTILTFRLRCHLDPNGLNTQNNKKCDSVFTAFWQLSPGVSVFCFRISNFRFHQLFWATFAALGFGLKASGNCEELCLMSCVGIVVVGGSNSYQNRVRVAVVVMELSTIIPWLTETEPKHGRARSGKAKHCQWQHNNTNTNRRFVTPTAPSIADSRSGLKRIGTISAMIYYYIHLR